MSVVQSRNLRVQYRWSLVMIPWYRQVISLVYGIGVIMIALWALEQGTGAYVILGIVGMSMLTLSMIFGVEIQEVQIGKVGRITFSDTERGRDDDE